MIIKLPSVDVTDRILEGAWPGYVEKSIKNFIFLSPCGITIKHWINVVNFGNR